MEESRHRQLKRQANAVASQIDYQLNEGGMPRFASVLGLPQTASDTEYLGVVKSRMAEVLFPLEDVPEMGLHDRGAEGDSLLHVACGWGDLRAVRLLVDAGCEIDATDEMGSTPLHVAVNGRHLDIVELLVRRGAAPNVIDAFGYSPLAWALQMGYSEIADALRKR